MAEEDLGAMPAGRPVVPVKADLVMGHTSGWDIRNAYPQVLELLGINTSDEKAVVHGVLSLLVKYVIEGKSINEVDDMINELKGLA